MRGFRFIVLITYIHTHTHTHTHIVTRGVYSNDGANAPWKKYGGEAFLQKLRGEVH